MYQAKYGDGSVRMFETESFEMACKMANAYSGPIMSVTKTSEVPRVEMYSQCDIEPEPDNRMIEVGKAKGTRKRKA